MCFFFLSPIHSTNYKPYDVYKFFEGAGSSYLLRLFNCVLMTQTLSPIFLFQLKKYHDLWSFIISENEEEKWENSVTIDSPVLLWFNSAAVWERQCEVWWQLKTKEKFENKNREKTFKDSE